MAARNALLRRIKTGLYLCACLTAAHARPPGIPVDTGLFHPRSLPCLAVQSHGVDTIAEYRREDGHENRNSHNKILFRAGSWLGRDGRYLLPPPADTETSITLRALHGTELSPSQISLSPCPESMPAQAVSALGAALDERLRIYLGQSVAEPQAAQHFETALRWLSRPGLEHWLAVAHYETGAFHRAAGRLHAADHHYAAALALFDTLDDIRGSAAAVNALGLVAWRGGLTDEARDRFLGAMALRERIGDNYATASIANNLGLLHAQRGEIAQALEYYEWALNRFQGTLDLRRPVSPGQAAEAGGHFQGDADLPAALNTLNNLALLWRDRDQVALAERYWRNYLILAPRLADAQAVARAQHNLGQLLSRQGRLDESLLLLADALQQFEHAGTTRWIAETQVQLSQLYVRLGDPDTAFRHARQAADLALEDIAVAADVQRHLGALQQQQGRYADAHESLQVAADLARRADSINRQLTIRTDLARLRFLQGEADVALDALTRVYHEFNQLEQAGNAALVLSRIGEIHLHNGNTAEARQALEAALAGHRSRDDLFAELLTLELLGRVYQRTSPDQVIETNHSAIQLIETLRATPLPPLRRAELLALSRSVYDRQVLALLDAGLPDQAWLVTERTRAGSIAELRQIQARGRDDPPRQALLDRHADRIERLYRATAQTAIGDHADRTGADDLTQLLRDIDQVETELQRRNGSPFPVTRPVSLAERRADLGPGRVLLSYHLLPDEVVLWVIGNDAARVMRLDTGDGLEPLINDLLTGARHPRQAIGRTTRIAHELAGLLLEPAAAEIRAADQLLIQPDGVLHALPFALLPSPGTEALLMDTHAITVMLGADRRQAGAGPVTAKPSLLVLADPGWETQDTGHGLLPGESLLGQLLRDQPPNALPGTRREALAIAELAAGHVDVRLKLGANASREFMLSGELGGYHTIHIATHGLVDLRYPMLSALILVAGETGAPAFIRPHDIAELELKAGLVVLSGCDTGHGRIIAGEGSMSLARPFLIAGADQVLASLWKVEDHRAALFMQRFYHHLLIESLPPATALAGAQRWMRQQTETAHPYYWAGFMLTASR